MADDKEKSVPQGQDLDASNGLAPQMPGAAGKLGSYKTSASQTAIDALSKTDETVLRVKK